MTRARDAADQINRVNSSAADANAITIDSSENVLVGGTAYEGSSSSNASSSYLGSNGFISANVTNDYGMQVNRTGTDGALFNGRKNGSDVGSIGSYGGSGMYAMAPTSGGSGLLFFSNAAPIYPIQNVSGTATISNGVSDLGAAVHRFKDLYLSGGVFLGGTGAANKLDDVEFGTWTPTLPNGGSAGVNGAFYTKVGQQVHLQAQVTFTPTNNGSQFQIGGVPFVSKAGGSTYSAGSLGYSGALNTTHFGDPLINHNSGNYLYFHAMNGGATILNNAFGGAAHNLIFAITYITNA